METQTNEKYVPPLRAIRLKCLDCSGGSYTEVELCPSTDCPLWHYRFGKNPFRKPKNLTEEQRKQIGERLHASKTNGENKQILPAKLEREISEEDEDEL